MYDLLSAHASVVINNLLSARVSVVINCTTRLMYPIIGDRIHEPHFIMYAHGSVVINDWMSVVSTYSADGCPVVVSCRLQVGRDTSIWTYYVEMCCPIRNFLRTRSMLTGHHVLNSTKCFTRGSTA